MKGKCDSGKDESRVFAVWKESHLRAFKAMDKELRSHPMLDSFCSGTTAVTVVKQDQDLVIANVGDSRAILGTMSDDDSLTAVQLTVDLKPNLPKEAERIRNCRGRVFALEDEPEVYRVWLPSDDSPGLAMARAFGDFCLKEFGVIADPEITYRHLTSRDRFVVLATDGVWDVLTNQEVVRIVFSAPCREVAAKVVVESAVKAWRRKYPTSKVDDCAAVCLYVDSQSTTSRPLATEDESSNQERMLQSDFPENTVASNNNNNNDNSSQQVQTENLGEEQRPDEKETHRTLAEYINTDEWSALDGVSRVNSLLSLPRFMRGDMKDELSKRRKCLH
uniref:PPM-type phosphatase domain-containing protein n=1 Tax=Araucaria cunninghamii TaxID=56994 RepID=A0A0D6R6Y8_ARACU